jgi:CheY-like chemotaxis protein
MGATYSVLVADADRDCADAIALLLNRSGIEASSTYDGREAIMLAERLHPCAVVMETQMPCVSGYEAAREMRQRLGLGLRLVAYTQFASHAERMRIADAGFDACVPKTAETLELLRVMSPTVHDTVVQSIRVNVRQMRNQLTLAGSLLDHADIAADSRVRNGIQAFLGTRIEGVVASMSGLPLAAAERAELWGEVEALRERVQRYAPS